MGTYYVPGRLVVVVALVAQVALLAVYAWALKRHRHRCFVPLVLAALLGLAYAIATGLPFFFPMGLSAHLLIAKATLALLLIGGVLAVWGALLLVRSYSALAARVAGGPDSRA